MTHIAVRNSVSVAALVSASNDKTVRLWDMEQPKLLRTVSTQEGGVYSARFSSDGKTILTAGADKTCRLINVEDSSEIRKYTGPEFALYSAVFSPDGKTIAAAGVRKPAWMEAR